MNPARAAIVLALVLPSAVATAADIASLAPPRHVAPPLAEQAATNRAFTGIPSMAVTPRGRLWATWYAGVTPGEDANNYVVLSTSGDGGSTWQEVLVVDPDADGSVRAFDPELWVSPDGRLFLFWCRWTGDVATRSSACGASRRPRPRPTGRNGRSRDASATAS